MKLIKAAIVAVTFAASLSAVANIHRAIPSF